MKLERAREIYSAYADGTLSPAMRLALEQHFEADPAAQQDYEEFIRVMDLLNATSQEPEVDPPLGFRARILEKVAMEQASQPAPKSINVADLGLNPTGKWWNWIVKPGRREATGALAGVLATALIMAIFLRPSTPGGIKPVVGTLGGFPVVSTPLPVVSDPTIRGVSTGTVNNTYYHYIRVHLPANIPGATVTGYAISSTDQILDPAVRERDALPVFKDPVKLANDEEMTIPIALLRAAPAGSTLNILIEWKSGSQSAAQVVFTPMNPDDGMTPNAAPSSNGNFFDSLQTIASAYHKTVIVDAESAPTHFVQSWSADDTIDKALDNVAASAGYNVKKTDESTYLVYKTK